MREWITINGRKMIWEDFIRALAYYSVRDVIRVKGEFVVSNYGKMNYVIRELTNDYHFGLDFIMDDLDDFITRNLLKMPVERTLPNALEELFNQMQTNIHVDLSQMLDECEERSKETYKRMQEDIKKENERTKMVQTMQIEDDAVSKKVSYLINLQRAKIINPDYHIEPKEIMATNIWCETLILSLSSEVITYEIMKRAVEDEFVTEDDISELLENKYHVDKDYEWYEEDFCGCDLDEFTEIKIKDFLELCEKVFLQILGLSGEFNCYM